MIVIVMGVSGSGKTTAGKMLAKELNCEFFDADDFHSQANKEKMAQGIPLNDEDRAEWLTSLRELLGKYEEVRRTTIPMSSPVNSGATHPHQSVVLACSALKKAYREKLAASGGVRFVYLKGTFAQIESRLKARKGHYMPVQLLASQFEALEEPIDAVVVDISKPPEEIIQIILKGITA